MIKDQNKKDFSPVIVIASVSAGPFNLGAPAAERFHVPFRVVSAVLQFVTGIITALVAFSLMPSAIRSGPYLWVVFGFFLGGALLGYGLLRNQALEI